MIGETERAAAAKRPPVALEPLSREQWLQKQFGGGDPTILTGANAFVAMIERLGGEVGVSQRQGSIYAGFRGLDGKMFSPFHLWGETSVSFTLRFIHDRPGIRDESVRLGLLHDLAALVGPLTTMNPRGFPSFKADLLAQASTATAVEQWMANALERMR